MQFRVLTRSFIGNTLVEPGTIITLPDDIKPGSNLEKIEPEKPAKPTKGDKTSTET